MPLRLHWRGDRAAQAGGPVVVLPDEAEQAIKAQVDAMAARGGPETQLAAAIAGAQLRSAALAALVSRAGSPRIGPYRRYLEGAADLYSHAAAGAAEAWDVSRAAGERLRGRR